MKIKTILILTSLLFSVYADDINYFTQSELLKEKLNLFKNLNYDKIPNNIFLKYGDSNNYIIEIKKYLFLSGEYKNYSNLTNLFDDDLYLSIKKYQINNGLTPNGDINKKTINSINFGISNMYSILEKNLNRVEKNNYNKNTIIVNIPFYNLYIYQESNFIYKMNVIVGKKDHQSCTLNSEITNVVFNPSWYVPNSISQKEMINKLQDNPEYFIKRGFRVYNNNEELNLDNLDLTGVNLEELKFVQTPSDKNALGKIKFIFPNNCGIYLHDTNQKELFGKDTQNLSHGCIRIEEPFYLAKYLLNYNGINDNKTKEYYYSKGTKSIYLNQNYQINIIYQNVVINNEHEIVYRKDIYNKN